MMVWSQKRKYNTKEEGQSQGNEEVWIDKTEKEHDKEFSNQSPGREIKDNVLSNTPVIVSQDTMSKLIELEKQVTKRVEEADKEKKKSESVNKNVGLNDPPIFRLLSQESNEENPDAEKVHTKKVGQEKETVDVRGKEKVGEETVLVEVGEESVKMMGERHNEKDTMLGGKTK
ncbi:hypothetical protein L1987_45686 [Smallanthus sonchifolius]|uniref:Uncharacterized protein n=1 Tax=Smallanthus sonchifolius TaxID=185202 RepID=A0ACB9FY94_9ASTR|nr:hypothetical protein L1987_45686 [Smallanthus sonchifolius]